MLYGGHHVAVAACVHGKPIAHLSPSDKGEREGDYALIYRHEKVDQAMMWSRGQWVPSTWQDSPL